jgi:hypothetical protein
MRLGPTARKGRADDEGPCCGHRADRSGDGRRRLFHFNPVILIFPSLGFGLYMVTRIGGPQLPADAPIMWGSGHGIYMRGKDYASDNDTSCGENPREGDGFR